MIVAKTDWACVRRQASADRGASRIGVRRGKVIRQQAKFTRQPPPKTPPQTHTVSCSASPLNTHLTTIEMPGSMRRSFMKNWWAVEVRSIFLLSRPNKAWRPTEPCHLRPFQCEYCRRITPTHSPNLDSHPADSAS